MEKSAYLAVSYLCNESCEFCPCSANEKKEGMVTPLGELTDSADAFYENGVERVVISGGEPTLHPDLACLTGYIQKRGMKVTLLTNGELFSVPKFVDGFTCRVNMPELTVITTLHSHIPAEHESANRTPGSFGRTITGLLKLCSCQCGVIVKHCITKHNYRDLAGFYKYCDETFPENVSLQMCGIDYCGIPEDRLEREMLSFPEMKPYLEELFDEHIRKQDSGSRRRLYSINIPLCAADVYYWNEKHLMKKKSGKTYQAYKDPRRNAVSDVENNVSVFPEVCNHCKAAGLCEGTYRSAFDAFGGRIIRPYI